VMIRKQIIGNMTDLLRAHFERLPVVVNYWVLSVMPCLQDPESKAQELVQEVGNCFSRMFYILIIFSLAFARSVFWKSS